MAKEKEIVQTEDCRQRTEESGGERGRVREREGRGRDTDRQTDT